MSNDFFDLVDKKGYSEKITCGLSPIDSSIGGFTCGGNYLVAGHRKSGKSSLVIGFINHWLSKGLIVAYLNSEMDERHLMDMLQANYYDKTKNDLEHEDDQMYKNRFKGKFLYSGPDSIRDSLGLSVTKIESELLTHIHSGAKVIVADNLTKLQESVPNGKSGYINLAAGVSAVTKICRNENVLGFTVLHTKDELMFTETPEGIAKAVADKLPEKIFEKSVTILKKPSSASIYGGGSSRTDLLGTILLWRPYQMFSDPRYSELSQLIFEDFRGQTPPESLRLIFDGSKNKFAQDIAEVAKAIFEKNEVVEVPENKIDSNEELPF